MRFRVIQRLVARLAVLTFTSTPLATASATDTLRTEQDSKAKAGLEAALTAAPAPTTSTAAGLEETSAQVRARIVDRTVSVMRVASSAGLNLSWLERDVQALKLFLVGGLALDALAQITEMAYPADYPAFLDTAYHYPLPAGANISEVSYGLLYSDQSHAKAVANVLAAGVPTKTAESMVRHMEATVRWLKLLASRPQERPPLIVIGPECHDTPLAGFEGLNHQILVAKPDTTPAQLVNTVEEREQSSFLYVGNRTGYAAILQLAQARDISSQFLEAPTTSTTAEHLLVALAALLHAFKIDPKDKQLRQYLNDLETRRQA